MFKKLITRLYKKYGQPDVVSMTREQMQGVTHEFDISSLQGKDQVLVAKSAKDVLANEVFQMAVNNVKDRVMKHVREEAGSAEIIFYDRFTINGVSLLVEELEDYASMDEVVEGSYNKFAPI